MIKTHAKTCDDGCPPVPDFERLQFYYGRSLTVADFQTEQQYFLDKLRLHNRCFHGTGIVCGLGVEPVPPAVDCEGHEERKRRELERELREKQRLLARLEAAGEGEGGEGARALEAEIEEIQRQLDGLPDCHHRKAPPRHELQVDCGWAIDCHGREIFVRSPQILDLACMLSPQDRRALEEAESDCDRGDPVLELRICYCELPTYPSRPLASDRCDVLDKCRYGRLREGYRFELSLEHLPEDTRCSNCCEPCEHDCIVLAHLRWPGREPLSPEHIDWSPRRELSVYQPSVVEGISWRHGAVYSSADAKQVLGTEGGPQPRGEGVEVRFSKPVHAETLQPGVVDLWRVQGGRGLAGVISHIEGSFVGKPDQGLVDHFRYRDESGETLNSGDRVLILVRSNFILDACCRPVDGEHVGGLVPQLADYVDRPEPCSVPPQPPCAQRRRPWTSGNGQPGSTFESWIFIR